MKGFLMNKIIKAALVCALISVPFNALPKEPKRKQSAQAKEAQFVSALELALGAVGSIYLVDQVEVLKGQEAIRSILKSKKTTKNQNVYF